MMVDDKTRENSVVVIGSMALLRVSYLSGRTLNVEFVVVIIFRITFSLQEFGNPS